jgi:serine protease Do
MGYYDREDRPTRSTFNSGVCRFLAVVVVSALVGSGATLATYGHAAQSEIPFNAPSQSTAVSPSTELTAFNVSMQKGVVNVVKKVEPAVVGIVNYKRVSDYFSDQTKLQPNDVGSGVLINKTNQYGYFVTNNHVVQGAAKVEVVMKKGSHVTATVVGTDPFTDLAVVRVPANAVKGVNPIPFANSDNLQVGEPAIAIGSPMGLDFEDSVTSGIVSAKSRVMPVEQVDDPSQNILDYQTVIQTDAAINPGNSGGPLLNINGQIIGINSSKIVDPTVEGMGFAIPANEVESITAQITKTGHAEHPSLGIEGYSLASLPEQWWPDVPVDYGVMIAKVTSTATKRAGLRAQDVIVSFNGHDIKTMADLRTYLFMAKPGQTVNMKVYRGDNELNIKVPLGKMQSPNTTTSGAQADASGRGTDLFGLFGN